MFVIDDSILVGTEKIHNFGWFLPSEVQRERVSKEVREFFNRLF